MAKRSKDIDSTFVNLEILRIIPKFPQAISTHKIHKHLIDKGFERDLRSTQRALKMLSEHFDLICDDSVRPFTYSWKEKSQGLNLPMLTEQQSLMLVLAQQQLKYMLPANIIHSIQPFFEEAERKIFSASGKPEGEWLDKVLNVPTSLPLIPAKVSEAIFDAVSVALFKNNYLNIQYKNQNGKTHESQVMPLALVQQGASTYLVARYDGFEDNRLLALHRIQSATISTFTFKRPDDFNLKDYEEKGYLGFGSSGRKIQLRFSTFRSSGFHLTETPLSNDQEILEQSETHYRFQATVAENDMLEWWIAQFGEDIWDIERIYL